MVSSGLGSMASINALRATYSLDVADGEEAVGHDQKFLAEGDLCGSGCPAGSGRWGRKLPHRRRTRGCQLVTSQDPDGVTGFVSTMIR